MIVNTTSTMLRSGAARTCTLQPFLFRSSSTTTSSTCAYSTFPASPFSARSKLINSSPTAATSSSNPILILRASQQQTTVPASCRKASTAPRTTPKTTTSPRAPLDPAAPPLDWNTFFQLRKSRRRWQVGFSVLMSLASGTGGAVLLSTGAADPLTSQVPLDPIMTMGLMTIGFVALGWLAGPSLGSAVFYLINRRYKVPMTVKESQFFARIKKNRVDPSNSSTGNPVPDFYGEKISSVAGYRQWLKDQRAYNKKRTTFI